MTIDTKTVATISLVLTLVGLAYNPTAITLAAFCASVALLALAEALAGHAEKSLRALKEAQALELGKMYTRLNDVSAKVEQLLMRGGR